MTTSLSNKGHLKRAAEEVHGELGAGFTEAVYHSALSYELSERGIPFTTEGTVPVLYKGAPVGRRRPDLFVDDGFGETLVVELKAGSTRGEEQLLQYLDLLSDDTNFDIHAGVLIQFNEECEFNERKV